MMTAANHGRLSTVVDTTRTESAFAYLAGVLCLGFGLYVFGTTVVMVVHGWTPVPHWDQWDELISDAKQVFSPWLYHQKNEHRLLFPRLLFAVDRFGFAETNEFNFFANLGLCLALASLIVFIAHRHVSRRMADTLWIAGITMTLLFSAMQYENFLWGFQVQFFGVELAAVASMGCLVLGRCSWISLIASTFFSAIAVYTLASGISVPFLAIPLAIWAQRPRAQMMLVVIAAVVLLASYLHGYVSPTNHSSPLVSIFRPGLIHYAAAEIGNPASSFLQTMGLSPGASSIPGLAVGAIGLGLFGVTTLILLRRGWAIDRAQLLFYGAASYGVGVAFLTAMGRLQFGAGQALSSRYASPMLLFWLALSMIAISEIYRRRSDLIPAARGLTIFLLFGLAWANPAFVRVGLAWASPGREAMTALLANVEDSEELGTLYPNLDRLKQLSAELKAQRLALFADAWSVWLGTPLSDHVEVDDSVQCRGRIDQVERLPVPGKAQWRAGGWAWDNLRGAPTDRIVFADEGGRVVGYALGDYPAKLGSGGPKHSGWRGHFTAENAASVTAYALIDGERAACPLRN